MSLMYKVNKLKSNRQKWFILLEDQSQPLPSPRRIVQKLLDADGEGLRQALRSYVQHRTE